MSREDTHRQKAAEIRQQLRAERNVSTRLELELLALAFDRLADHAARNAGNKIVYEYDFDPAAARHEPEPPLAQAQPQPQPRPKRP